MSFLNTCCDTWKWLSSGFTCAIVLSGLRKKNHSSHYLKEVQKSVFVQLGMELLSGDIQNTFYFRTFSVTLHLSDVLCIDVPVNSWWVSHGASRPWGFPSPQLQRESLSLGHIWPWSGIHRTSTRPGPLLPCQSACLLPGKSCRFGWSRRSGASDEL